MTKVDSIKFKAEVARLNETTANLRAETRRLETRNPWYQLVAGAMLMLIICAFMGFLLR